MLLIKIGISFAVNLFLTGQLSLQKLRLFCINYGMFQSVFEAIFWILFNCDYLKL